MKNSKEYVKWLFRLFRKKDGVESWRELKTHKCTDKDYDQFYQVDKNQFKLLEEIKRDPKRGLMCLDEDDSVQLKLYGREKYDDYQRLELLMLPCNSINTEAGFMEGEQGTVSQECELDLEKQEQYVG